ncbi:class IV adenylate cyclase [Haladaptatus sp. DYSN1]|uniref:class IV adenylate cyclase n=1 Tax=unclassified Haladaptatus TaxID=2622732 RepID=UPI0024063DE7|nr:class IV adenylate cyclase [Haladaptatus sp. DYSN1]
MYEVEVKVRADHDAVREKLAACGATQVRTVTQRDTYYNAPDRDFAETDEALRIRTEMTDEETVTKVTYKGPLVEQESKTRKEAETVVADGETMDRILSGLGYAATATVEKRRVFYELDGYTVTLDDVTGLGEFVEVETEVEGAVEPAREGAYNVLEKLGVDPETQIRTSYLGLLLESNNSE